MKMNLFYSTVPFNTINPGFLGQIKNLQRTILNNNWYNSIFALYLIFSILNGKPEKAFNRDSRL